MSLANRLTGAAALASMLAGCGGGNAALADRAASEGVAAAPAGSAPATADFIATARAAPCANQQNRLFMIERQRVFWDRASSCADDAYGRTLFGATPQQVLCSVNDSLAGPRASCPDESARAMFSTIVANLDKSDLGLGSAHTVEPIVFH